MSVFVKRESNGQLLVKMQAPPRFYCVNYQEVTVENFPMRIWQWLFENEETNKTSMIWVMDQITMTLLTTDNPRGRISFNDRDRRSANSVRVFHESPHALFVPDVSNPGYAYHCNLNGQVFSGSNTFHDGRLCLGESFAPYNFAGIHLLCNYDANADLSWVGGSVETNHPDPDNQRRVRTWPTTRTSITLQIPQQISDFFNR